MHGLRTVVAVFSLLAVNFVAANTIEVDYLARLQELESKVNELADVKAELHEAKDAAESLRIELSSRVLSAGNTYAGALNHMWLLLCGALVMLMQAGFAMLEAGACRAKNAQNLLLKNLTDICLGTLCWWCCGYAFAYGVKEDGPSNNFGGDAKFFADSFFTEITDEGIHTASGDHLAWFFQWAFCGAAATIVSGGVAERINFPGYVIYTTCMTSFIYPIIVYWTWSGAGWLYAGEDAITDVGYYDFAGSGIVHMTGGVGALCGAIIVGPREGRFVRDESEFAPHNIPLVVLGTFLLWFGWYGFNCGSTLGMDSEGTGQLAALVAMNTTIAAATGGLTVFLLRLALLRRYDVGGLCNGILAGLVSITAPCGNVENYAAFFIAILGGCIYQGVSMLLQMVKVDDPLDAFAVHGACGFWGALSAVIFDWGKGFDIFNGWGGFDCTRDVDGNCYSGGWTSALGAQIVGLIAIILWTVFWSVLIMVPMRLAGLLRAPDEVQQSGMDLAKHSPTKAYDSGDGLTQASPSKLVQVMPTK
mmetsp:Transcript_43553/g.98095  ORF Transcript_43553/g.98095 Transcript_43553/m.98095 type:complete len:533 (+) Transcript_43553:88-1686(+)